MQKVYIFKEIIRQLLYVRKKVMSIILYIVIHNTWNKLKQGFLKFYCEYDVAKNIASLKYFCVK